MTRLPLVLFLALLIPGCSSGGVTVEWTTATETQTAGFNVYRADQPEGSFLKVNPKLIPGASDPLRGGQYRFRDESADSSRTYYYKLEEVEFDGGTNWYGPVVVRPTFPAWAIAGLLTGLILSVGGIWYAKSRRKTLV